MDIELTIRNIVRDELAKAAAAGHEPEMITVAEAIRVLGIGRSKVYRLVDESPANGFPAVRLGTRTIRIDKRRLHPWIASGGLGVKA